MKPVCSAVLLFAVQKSVLAQDNTCESDEFECGSGRCIPQTWVCDYENDCNDRSDELNCPPCSESGYQCQTDSNDPDISAKCIPSQWLCDKWNDCPLKDDELYCTQCSTDSESDPRTWRCPSNFTDIHECIEPKRVCDYVNDCYNGGDEQGCEYDSCELDPQSFRCDENNSTCLARHRVCDDVIDCHDATDECQCQDSTIECVAAPTSSPTTPSPIDSTPVWKWCPQQAGLVYLGLSTSSVERAKNTSIGVYWTPPSLRNNPVVSVKTDTGFQPGDTFAPGRYQIPYTTACEQSDHDSEEYQTCLSFETLACTVDLLVFWNASVGDLRQCTSSDVIYKLSLEADSRHFSVFWSHTGADSHSGVISEEDEHYEYFANAKLQTKQESEDGSDSQHHKCYATVTLIESENSASSTSNSNTDNVASAIEWMIEEVWPLTVIIVILVGLVCFVVGCLLFLYKKTQDYDAMEFEESYSRSESYTPEDMELYNPVTGTYAHEIYDRVPMNRHKRIASQMHPFAHIPAAHMTSAQGVSAGATESADGTSQSIAGLPASMIAHGMAGSRTGSRRFSENIHALGSSYAGDRALRERAPTREDVEAWRAARVNVSGRSGSVNLSSHRGSFAAHGRRIMSPAEPLPPLDQSANEEHSAPPDSRTDIHPISEPHSPSPGPRSRTGRRGSRTEEAASISDAPQCSSAANVSNGNQHPKAPTRRASVLGISLEEIAAMRQADEDSEREQRRQQRQAVSVSGDMEDEEQAFMQAVLDEPSVLSSEDGYQ